MSWSEICYCSFHIRQKLHSADVVEESPVSLPHRHIQYIHNHKFSLSLISGSSASFFPSVITSHVPHQAADWILIAALNEFQEERLRERRRDRERNLSPLNEFCLSLIPVVSPSVCVSVNVCDRIGFFYDGLIKRWHIHSCQTPNVHSVFDRSIVSCVF